ncbi:adenosylcobinamide-GDP ribazoletransferase [Stappia stellulata]|uniref:adenosylcobinamide-GDP ribazoletransferase n=1 Tax=Stappia stellulata TaxID=71235 RepID=UPI0003FC5859|nr:adenosylcobinamide-GDP ribazoletransferase [Stappia stellulata]
MPSADDRPALTAIWTPGRLLADVAATLRFFSRIAVPAVNRHDDPARLPDFRRAAAVAPVSAIVIALPGITVFWLALQTALPASVAALFGLAVGIALTGALHEDGLADVADGFFGAGRPERRLEIMKDSRIGAFGTLALISALGLKTLLVATLALRYGGGGAALGWLAAESGSRAAFVAVWKALPPARPDGLAAKCGTPTRRAVDFAAALALLPFAAALSVYGPAAVTLAIVAQAAAGVAVARLAIAKIGGQTGDVLGATQQASCLAGLTGLCILV